MAAKKRKRALWVTLTLLVLASAAIFSLKAINNKPAKIDPEKTRLQTIRGVGYVLKSA